MQKLRVWFPKETIQGYILATQEINGKSVAEKNQQNQLVMNVHSF